MLTLATIWDRILSDPKAEFLSSPSQRLSYGGFADMVRGALALFDAQGLTPGCRVMILTGSEGVAIAIFAATLLDGLVPVMLTPDTPEGRATALATSVTPDLIVCDAAREAEAWARRAPRLTVRTAHVPEPTRWRLPSLGRRERPGSTFGIDLPDGGRSPRLPDSNDELAYILFTSGTTQTPSGVMVTRRNILANLVTMSRVFDYDSGSRIFNDMVLAHGDGLVQGPLLALANGCALIRSGGFSVPGLETWLNRVRQEHATHVITVPTVWAMIDRYAQHDDYFDAPECRGLLSVAARLDAGLWKRIETRFGKPVFNQYGLTETVASALYAGPQPEMGGFDTIGRPIDCEARIAAQGVTQTFVGDSGELQLRGDNIFAGYWQNSARTAEAFTSDGWMRTGDVCRMRSDGSYEILGRIKTVIMSGGFLIRPEEIDEAMMAHDLVRESATVGLGDVTFGEIAVTAVVLDAPVDEAALTAHARTRLEALKVPKRIVVLPAIPRGDAGKPVLEKLRTELETALSVESDSEAGTGDMTAEVYALAAEVFRVDIATLGPSSSPDTVPGWDSFSQLTLIFATEDRFKIRIPAARVAGMRSLAELVVAVAEVRT